MTQFWPLVWRFLRADKYQSWGMEVVGTNCCIPVRWMGFDFKVQKRAVCFDMKFWGLDSLELESVIWASRDGQGG